MTSASDFEQAVAGEEWELADQILRLADWCVLEESGPLPNDTSTAPAVAFYEHLAEKRAYWKYFAEWFSQLQFERLLSTFRYHLSEKDLQELKKTYAKRNA